MLDQPRSLLEFQHNFPDDAACVRYLASRRWPTGFVCPGCGTTRAYELVDRRVWQCVACRQQTSLTAGTVLHGTRLPLITWFWAMYLVATMTNGISARQLSKQLGLRRYETAWMLLQKIRLAMVNPERGPLSGEVEVDTTWIGRGVAGASGRSSFGRDSLLVALAVEHHDHGLGRLRLGLIRDASGPSITDFVLRNIVRGSTLYSDDWAGYGLLLTAGYLHQPRRARSRSVEEGGTGEVASIVPSTHRIAANLKMWLHGTHRGVGAQHLERYLEEFVFRFNRRLYPPAAFDTLLGLTFKVEPTAYTELRGPRPAAGRPRRRGRATGFTPLRARPSWPAPGEPPRIGPGDSAE